MEKKDYLEPASIQRPSDVQSDALPAELSKIKMKARGSRAITLL